MIVSVRGALVALATLSACAHRAPPPSPAATPDSCLVALTRADVPDAVCQTWADDTLLLGIRLEERHAWLAAAEAYHAMVDAGFAVGTPRGYAAHVGLGKALHAAGLAYNAAPWLVAVLLQGPHGPGYGKTFRMFRAGQAQGVVIPIADARALAATATDPLTPALRAEVRFVAGRILARHGDRQAARPLLADVPAGHRDYDAAQRLLRDLADAPTEPAPEVP